MSVSNFLLGRRTFCSDHEIIEQIRRSKNYRNDLAEGSAHALLIFDTTNQHTWMVCSTMRLYIVLDDIRKSEPRIQWTTKQIPPKVSLDTRSERTGIVRLNDRPRGWLYSTRLFATIPIEAQIENLVVKAKNTSLRPKQTGTA